MAKSELCDVTEPTCLSPGHKNVCVSPRIFTEHDLIRLKTGPTHESRRRQSNQNAPAPLVIANHHQRHGTEHETAPASRDDGPVIVRYHAASCQSRAMRLEDVNTLQLGAARRR